MTAAAVDRVLDPTWNLDEVPIEAKRAGMRLLHRLKAPGVGVDRIVVAPVFDGMLDGKVVDPDGAEGGSAPSGSSAGEGKYIGYIGVTWLRGERAWSAVVDAEEVNRSGDAIAAALTVNACKSIQAALERATIARFGHLEPLPVASPETDYWWVSPPRRRLRAVADQLRRARAEATADLFAGGS